MASTKNSQNPYQYKTIDELKFVQMSNLTTATNNANSWKQKMEIIHLICFLTQAMKKAKPDKYSSCIDVLESIFGGSLLMMDSGGTISCVRAFGLLCDDLMWATNDEISKPEGYSNAKEIKDRLLTYFNDEWAPF